MVSARWAVWRSEVGKVRRKIWPSRGLRIGTFVFVLSFAVTPNPTVWWTCLRHRLVEALRGNVDTVLDALSVPTSNYQSRAIARQARQS